MKLRLTHKVVGQIVATGVIIMAAIILVTTNFVKDYERDQMVQLSNMMGSAVRVSASDVFEDLVQDAELLRGNVENIKYDEVNSKVLNEELKIYMSYNENIEGAFIIYDKENYTYHPYWYRKSGYTFQGYLEDYEDPKYRALIQSGETAVLDPQTYHQGDEIVVLSTITVPFETRDGLKGLVGINFSIDNFEGLLEEMSTSEYMNSYLISSSGLIVGDTNADGKIISMEDAGLNSEWISSEYADKGLILSGDTYLLNITIPVHRTQQEWTLLAIVNADFLHSRNNTVSWMITVPLLIGILTLAFFVRYTVKKNLKPLENIVELMEYSKSGDLTKRSNIKTSDEIQVISEGLNDLLDALEDHREKLLDEINDNEMLNAELEDLIQENDRIYFETIKSFNMAIEAKDHYTAGHCDRVTEYSLAIADEIGLSDKEKVRLIYGATVHDVGKIGIAGTIINKPGKLTDDEFEKIKSHCEKGHTILEGIHFLSDSISIVYQHHERYDGKGYPQGLKGDEIDILARIVAITDTYDAMTSDRAYRKALSSDIAIEEIINNKGTQFDPNLVNAFVRAFEKGVIVVDDIDNTV